MKTKVQNQSHWDGSVVNLRTGLTIAEQYSLALGPRGAAIAAYAQLKHKDFNTWDYEERYGNSVMEGKYGFHLGDFSAPK